MKLSIFLPENKVAVWENKSADVAKIIEAVKSNPDAKTKTSKLRSITDSDEAKSFADNSFLCVTWSGVFDSIRSLGTFKLSSGLLSLHMFNLAPDRLDQLWNLLRKDEFTFALFIDEWGSGLVSIVRINCQSASQYASFIDQITSYYQDLYRITSIKNIPNGVEPEVNPESTAVDWLCRIPHHAEIYYNPGCKVMPLLEAYRKKPEPISPKVTSILKDLQNEQLNAEKASDKREGVASNTDQAQSTPTPKEVSFPLEVFPEKVQEIINQNATHQLYKPEWLGSSILVAASIAVGNLYGVEWKKYRQKAVFYLAIVGWPGTNKSGPLDYALAPIHKFDAEAYRVYKEEKSQFDQFQSLPKNKRESQEQLVLPTYKTILVSDITPEALVATHTQNPIGLGLYMDELAAWFQNFNRYSGGSEQQNWLSNWSFGKFKVLRLSRGPNIINNPHINVVGTIQPGILNDLAKDQRNKNGFVDRILFAFPDDQLKPHDADGSMDESITITYAALIARLLQLRETVKFDEQGEVVTNWISFTPDAFREVSRWRRKNTDLINQTDEKALKGVYSKLDAYILRFTLALILIDYACEESDLSEIKLSVVERAEKLTEYFRKNAEKVYRQLNNQSASDELPKDQQRLFNALPDEVTTAQAVSVAANLKPDISESTTKRLLKDSKLFRRVGYGQYAKIC